MVIAVGPELESALTEIARKQGVAPEMLALEALRERFLATDVQAPSQEEWERQLRNAASDCGVSLSNDAVSSEGLYD